MGLENTVSAGGAIDTLLRQVDEIAHTFVFHGYAALSKGLLPALTLAATVYIALIGWGSLQGQSPFSVGQAARHTLKIAIAVALATHWEVFSRSLYTVFTQGPNELSALLMQGTGSVSGTSGLQRSLDAGMNVGEGLWNLGGLSLKLAGVVVWLSTWCVTGMALLELTVAQFGLAVTLALAPFTSLFLLSDATKGLFEGWLKLAVGFALVPVLVTAVLLLVNTLLQHSAADIQSALDLEDATVHVIAPFILSGIVSIGLVLKAAQMAATLSHGIGLSAWGDARTTRQLMARYSGFHALKHAAAQRASTAYQKWRGR